MHNPLAITNLRFAYDRAAAPVLDIPSLTITPNQLVLLRGSSGCGKSTLLHVIAGLIEPNTGEVRVDNRNIHKLNGAARDRFRGQSIGMIFQTFNILPGFTALENVMMPMLFSAAIPPAEHRQRAAKLLKDLGIERPNANIETLSIGQQQRVAVARALACKPALVLADEPTASLDPDNASAAITLIHNACRDNKAALLCVSHDPSLGQGFDRVLNFTELASSQTPATTQPAGGEA